MIKVNNDELKSITHIDARTYFRLLGKWKIKKSGLEIISFGKSNVLYFDFNSSPGDTELLETKNELLFPFNTP